MIVIVQAKRKTQVTSNLFGKMVESAGYVLGGDHTANEITVEPAVFQKQLSQLFKKQASIDQSVEKFCSALIEYMEDARRTRSTGLDSLIRLLLGVDCLQPSLINHLFEKLLEFMDNPTGGTSSLQLRDYCQVPKLILNQLRWLDHIVNGTELCTKLLELIDVASYDLKHEVIASLPEILDDSQHSMAATHLKTLLQTTSDYTSAIIDSLTNLTVSAELGAQILEVAMARVSSAALVDLPTVIKYIMQQVTPSNAQELISELRDKLDLDTLFVPPPAACSTPRGTQRVVNKVSVEATSEYVIFDTINCSISYQKSVADGWMKTIESVTDAGGHKAVDIVVLLILHTVSSRRKAVETLFTSKVRGGQFTEDLLSSVFKLSSGALLKFFPSVLTLSEKLLCSGMPSVVQFAMCLYQHAFISFDVYCQQEVIAALMTHVGSGMAAEIDHALDVLGSLVETHPSAMNRFAVLVKNILDYLEHLYIHQVRKLYYVLSVLAFRSEESSIQDELHTVVRKQLSHVESRYRRMGVIGAAMMIQQLSYGGSPRADQTMCPSLSEEKEEPPHLSASRLKQAQTLITDTIQSCSQSQETATLFCDEMCVAIRHTAMNPSVLRSLCDTVVTQFQETFLVDCKDDLPTNLGVPLQLCHGLDTLDNDNIGLNLLPVAMAAHGLERNFLLQRVSSQFKLLRVCEQLLNSGSLEAVDALLGCPIVMCPEEILRLSAFEGLPTSTKQDLCLVLFHCINWMRELVCAFAGDKEPEMRAKVISRLATITKLQSQLDTCMSVHTSFFVRLRWIADRFCSIKTKQDQIQGDFCIRQKSSVCNNIDKVQLFFRKLDMDVFAVLHYAPLSKTIMDSEMHTAEREELVIQPAQLLFLLQDLHSKVSSSLSVAGFGARWRKPATTSAKQNTSFDNTAMQLAEKVVELMPALRDHIEITYASCQSTNVGDDVDGFCTDYPAQCDCLILLFKILAVFFAWHQLSDPLYSHLLHQSLELLSKTPHPSVSKDIGLAAKGACVYFERFSEHLPLISCSRPYVMLLVSICTACQSNAAQKRVAKICTQLLKHSWAESTMETTQQRTETLEYLLKYHFGWSVEPLKAVEEMCAKAVPELIGEDGGQSVSSIFPTLSRDSFPCFYKNMMITIVSQVKAIPLLTKGAQPSSEVLLDRLQSIHLSANVLYMLVTLVKSFEKRAVLSAALKYGTLYIEALLKFGMPVIDVEFRPHKDEVLTLLRTLQKSTRCFQNFCGHSKVQRDTTLTNHVPKLKKSLEMFMFKVMEMLVHHDCQEAFSVGNLRNRDLQGQEILSQVSKPSHSSQLRSERQTSPNPNDEAQEE
eukprot:Em0019g280a